VGVLTYLRWLDEDAGDEVVRVIHGELKTLIAVQVEPSRHPPT
jgi:hypothetical protein